MGAGKKKKNFTMSGSAQYFFGGNVSITARNLPKKDLGAVIFGCTHNTKNECCEGLIFGLPAVHMSYVKNIKPGLPIFLFNYSDRKLHGIYEAVSHGQMAIKPHGWTENGNEKTQYPAQVRVQMRQSCQPLVETQYQKILADNYHGETHHFWFELDHAQTGALLSLFESLPISIRRVVANASNYRDIYEGETSNSIPKQACSYIPPSSWADLFKENSVDDAKIEDENSKSLFLESDGTQLDNCDGTLSWYEKTLISENHHSDSDMEDEESDILWKLQRIALERENLDISSEKDTEEGYAPSDTHLEAECCPGAPNLEECRDVFVGPSDFTEEAFVGTHLEAECCAAAPDLENSEVVSTDYSDFQSVVNQLRCQLEGLKASSLDQLRTTSALEKKLVCSDIELQLLRDRVISLESQLSGSSATCVSEHGNEIFSEPFDEPKLGMKDHIFLMGGCDGDLSWLSTTECYSTSRDILRRMKPMGFARSYSSAAVSKDRIFNFGGWNSGQNDNPWCDTVECYNPRNNEWTSCPSLSERKGGLAGATVHNKIFAFGGGNGVDCSSKVEMFDPALERWIPTQSMIEKRFAAAAAELNGVLYVVGGYDGDCYMKSAERFDPREISWMKIEDMNTCRGSHCLAVLNERLYAMGGFNGTKMVSSVEVFDPRIDAWIVDDVEMTQSRGNFFAPVIGERIYTIGGMIQHGSYAETVDCYKQGQGWFVTNLKGIGKRSFFSAVLF